MKPSVHQGWKWLASQEFTHKETGKSDLRVKKKIQLIGTYSAMAQILVLADKIFKEDI